MPEIHGIKIHPSYRSDHSTVCLELKTKDRKRSEQYWKFHNSLLKDKNCIMIIKQLILDLKKELALPVYNLITLMIFLINYLVSNK